MKSAHISYEIRVEINNYIHYQEKYHNNNRSSWQLFLFVNIKLSNQQSILELSLLLLLL